MFWDGLIKVIKNDAAYVNGKTGRIMPLMQLLVVCLCLHIYSSTYIYMSVCVCLYIYIYICMYIYVYMYSLYTCELFWYQPIMRHHNETSEMLLVQCFTHPDRMRKASKSNKKKYPRKLEIFNFTLTKSEPKFAQHNKENVCKINCSSCSSQVCFILKQWQRRVQ